MASLAHVHSPARHQDLQTLPRRRSLPADPLFDVKVDAHQSLVEVSLRRTAPPYISFRVLEELALISHDMRDGRFGRPRAKILSSQLDGVFSLGGDLQFFARAIRAGDSGGLFRYARAGIDEIWSNLTGAGIPGLTTAAVVSGEAQGGGFEAALSCHLIVGERGTSFGFPEPLFGLYPGMGAFELIAARVDADVARRMISKPERYSADFLHEVGIVDYLVPKGNGLAFAKEILTLPPTEAQAARVSRLKQIRYQDLLSSVEHWTAQALGLSERDLRSMGYLLGAQRSSRHGAEFAQAV